MADERETVRIPPVVEDPRTQAKRDSDEWQLRFAELQSFKDSTQGLFRWIASEYEKFTDRPWWSASVYERYMYAYLMEVARQQVAYEIERELVCCDASEQGDPSHPHQLCYWGGQAAAIARESKRYGPPLEG